MMFSLLVPLLLVSFSDALNPQARDVRVINEAGFKVEIYWINRWKNDELVLNSEDGVFHGAETKIQSFISHEFEIQEVPSKKTGLCKGPENSCRKGYFQVNSNYEQLVVFKEDLAEIILTDSKTKAHDQAKAAIHECKAHALDLMGDGDAQASMDQLISCVEKSVDDAVQAKQEEIQFQENLRYSLGDRLVSYACVDPNVTMSESTENTTWTYEGRRYKVQQMFDRQASIVSYIENFVTPDECSAVEKGVQLVDTNGANGLFAEKGGMDISWGGGPVTSLADKMYAYAADALRLTNLDSSNAEQLFMIRYMGDDPENPSRYDPHCDGLCDGSTHVEGDRIVTMIAYCEVAKKGGHTHFSNSGIHIIPKKGSALMYSYWDQGTNKNDNGYTKHAGCPVLEGEKKIITHKIRK